MHWLPLEKAKMTSYSELEGWNVSLANVKHKKGLAIYRA